MAENDKSGIERKQTGSRLMPMSGKSPEERERLVDRRPMDERMPEISLDVELGEDERQRSKEREEMLKTRALSRSHLSYRSGQEVRWRWNSSTFHIALAFSQASPEITTSEMRM